MTIVTQRASTRGPRVPYQWPLGAPGFQRCTVALICTKYGTNTVHGSTMTIVTPGATLQA